MTTTPALEYLAATGVDHDVVRTRRADSVHDAAALRGVPVAAVLKSIVVRRGDDDYMFVLVPGDRAIDWAKLRRHLGVRRLSLPDAAQAKAATGYARGTITPFGSSSAWPVVADARVLELDIASIGGGDHGVSVLIGPHALVGNLEADVADVTRDAGPG